MNRKARRNMEKQLGITKLHQKKTTQQKLKNIGGNIESGKERKAKTERARTLQEQETSEGEITATINSLATTLTISEGLSWYDAIEKAKEIYKNDKGFV